MKALLLLTMLAGCANINDNTTLVDKAIVGTTLAVIAYGGATLGEW